jgi:hypothetical protein
MKHLLTFLFISAFSLTVGAQSCDELIETIKENYNGTTYTSFNSSAISQVTFYEVMVDYQTYYFAIVCFKQKYGYGCNEYIYQVGSMTQFNYASSYLTSAGKAFWKYIEPYSDTLGCAPDLD